MSAMDRRDEILRRLLLEEADPLAALEHSELGGDAAARAELQELLAAEERLAALGADEREALRAPAPGSAEHAAEQRVLGRVREELGLQRRSPRNLGARVALLLAAGIALALGLRWLGGGEVEPDPGTTMGTDWNAEIEQPIKDLLAYGAISWRGELPAGGYFVVRVLDASRNEIAVSGELVQNVWTPESDEWTTWPDEIWILVETWGPGPQDLKGRSPEVRTRRSP